MTLEELREGERRLAGLRWAAFRDDEPMDAAERRDLESLRARADEREDDLSMTIAETEPDTKRT